MIRPLSVLGVCALLAACSSTSTIGDEPSDNTLLGELEQSRKAWDALVAEQGETYYYTEENCLVNAEEAEVVTVQVERGNAREVASSYIPMGECLGHVNAFEDFTARTMPALYAECEELIRREGHEVSLVLDERGLLRDCSWPGPGEDECFDNCGEGFYLRTLELGTVY